MVPWEAGTRLGPYVLVSPIGAGGMGEVWKARDTRLDRIVAVKRLKGQHTQRFEQEARAIAALNHPHICQLYDVGPDYLVLEYVEGAPLRGPLPVADAVRLAVQMAGALETAHGKGIIHRDLKPGNILVARSGVKLLDFGLAKLVTGEDSDVTRTLEGTVLGTAAYMSPEQAQGKPLDERSDVFSFGAVLYEMLSGNRAFAGNSTAQILSAVLRDDPGPLEAPPALESIVRRCLAKLPSQRFQTMMDVKVALEGVSAKPGEAQPSIAVLPFANMSADKENEYFSDGLAEEIINSLAHIPGLKVIARTSAFAFRGKEQDIRKIAEALGVRTILEGSVRRAGSRVRVAAQLIDADDGSHLWSERYDREMADVFAIQDEIAQAIAGALKLKLAGETRYLPKLPAYEAFLKGRHHWMKFTVESLERSREYFEEAIALDPEFALAHSELATYFIQLAAYSIMPAHESMPLARSTAQKALHLDPSLPEAHAMLGAVAALYDYDWKEAERRFQQAMARDPVPPLVHNYFGFFYLMPVPGRLQEAADEIGRALREDPLNVLFRFYLAMCLQAAGRDEEASGEFRQILELGGTFLPAFFWLGHNYASRGMLTEALACAEKAFSLAPWNTEAIGGLAGLLVRTGDRSRAEWLLQKLGDGRAYGAPIGLVYFHLLSGEIDQAADWLEKAIEQRHFLVLLYLRSPLGKALRSSSRWPALAKMMNLPEAP